MNKSEIRNAIETISKESGYPQGCASELFEVFLDVIVDALSKGEPVKISNFGVFEVRQHGAVKRRNPRTGESLQICAKRAVLFHPAPALRGRLNQ